MLYFKGRCAVFFRTKAHYFLEVDGLYQALYRKWRSRTFDQVVGQSHITQTLKRQVESGRLSHAYLFTGTRGTGKTSCARILARAVNCENPQEGNPCNRCPSCLGIQNGSVLDVLELDAASNNRVDDVRAILEEAVYTPAAVKKRVYIVDEVHMLSQQAFNALLQILEEPPAHLMFVLATTELHKVPATIKSRCQQFSFKRIPMDSLLSHLSYVAREEGIALTPEGGNLIARLADGGMRDALSLLDQCAGEGGCVDEERVLSVLGLAGQIETAALMENVADGDISAALERLERLYAGGKEMSALAGEMSALVRDLLVQATAPKSGGALMTGGFDEGTLKRLAARLNTPRLVQMLCRLQNTAADLARSANRRTDMELCIVTLCDPTLDSSLAGLNVRVARLEQGGIPAPATPMKKKERVPAPAPERAQPPANGGEDDPPPWTEEPVSQVRKPTLGGGAPPRLKGAPNAKGTGEQGAASLPHNGWPGWPAFRDQLKGMMPVSDYSFVGSAAMTEGSWDGQTLTLWTANDFLRTMLDKQTITRPVTELAQKLMGAGAKVSVQVGSAPPQQEAPSSAGAAEDALEAFLAGGQDNITVE